MSRVYIVIPAHNEENFLRLCLEGLISQHLLPKRVVIVNDDSTDHTAQIIDDFCSRYSFFEKVTVLSNDDRHLPGSKVVKTFQRGLEVLDDDYDILMKLDADIVLPQDYLHKIAYIFGINPKIGIAGGFVCEKNENDNWILHHNMNKDHVRGAIKTYSKDCFKAMRGLRPYMGWDTVDELLTRYHGFEIFTDSTLLVKHLRHTGRGYHHKARCFQGEAMYRMRYGFFITLVASAKMAYLQRSFRVFVWNIIGFYRSYIRNLEFMVSKKEGIFIRELRYRNIFKRIFSR